MIKSANARLGYPAAHHFNESWISCVLCPCWLLSEYPIAKMHLGYLLECSSVGTALAISQSLYSATVLYGLPALPAAVAVYRVRGGRTGRRESAASLQVVPSLCDRVSCSISLVTHHGDAGQCSHVPSMTRLVPWAWTPRTLCDHRLTVMM